MNHDEIAEDAVENSPFLKRGEIYRVVENKGYGFIRGEDGRNYFFHFSSLLEGAPKRLTEGTIVSFESSRNKKGLTAINVGVIKDGKNITKYYIHDDFYIHQKGENVRRRFLKIDGVQICSEGFSEEEVKNNLKNKAMSLGVNGILNSSMEYKIKKERVGNDREIVEICGEPIVCYSRDDVGGEYSIGEVEGYFKRVKERLKTEANNFSEKFSQWLEEKKSAKGTVIVGIIGILIIGITGIITEDSNMTIFAMATMSVLALMLIAVIREREKNKDLDIDKGLVPFKLKKIKK